MMINQFLVDNKKNLKKTENEFFSSIPTEESKNSNKNINTNTNSNQLSGKNEMNNLDYVLNLINSFQGIEKIMKNLLIISIALAMREVLYSAYHDSQYYGNENDKNDKKKMHNKCISEVNFSKTKFYVLYS